MSDAGCSIMKALRRMLVLVLDSCALKDPEEEARREAGALMKLPPRCMLAGAIKARL